MSEYFLAGRLLGPGLAANVVRPFPAGSAVLPGFVSEWVTALEEHRNGRSR